MSNGRGSSLRSDRCHMLPYAGQTRLSGYLVMSLVHAALGRDHSLSALSCGMESGDVCSAGGEGPGQATGTGARSTRKALSKTLKRERQLPGLGGWGHPFLGLRPRLISTAPPGLGCEIERPALIGGRTRIQSCRFFQPQEMQARIQSLPTEASGDQSSLCSSPGLGG